MNLRKFISLLDEKCEYWLIIIFYTYLFAILTIEVILRAFNNSIVWAVESAIYGFIWMSYLSAAQLARHRQHLGFTLLRDNLGRTGQLICHAISDVCLITIATVVIYYMWEPVRDSIRFGQTFNAADTPIWIAMVAVPVGWLLVVLRVVQRFIRLIQDYRSGAPMIPKQAFSMDD